jgi:hypothetical protein
MPVTIGVDPHKASHTAAALDEHGQLLGRRRTPPPAKHASGAPASKSSGQLDST